MNSKRGRRTDPRSGEVINVAPGDDDASLAVGRPPQNIAQTQAWKASKQGAGRMWNNYKTNLVNAFQRMAREDQEALIQRTCMIVTIGVTGIALLLFYPFIPRLGRVFGVPAAVVGAYWLGTKLVTPVVLARIENILNKD